VTDQQGFPDRVQVPHFHAAELVNAITHGIGLLLSIAGAIVLISCAISCSDGWRLTGCSIFATSLVAVYAASTLSHSSSRPKLRHLFRILDQGLIYLLIAGTYTPIALAYLRSGWWWLLFGLMWTVALCGFLSKILYSYRVGVAVWTYVLLGWMPILTTGALIELVPTDALWWMLNGGICYTVGTVFLVGDNQRFHFHAIWHLFVIAGSTCHFFTVLFFVAYAPIV
jgi:hemolysin III